MHTLLLMKNQLRGLFLALFMAVSPMCFAQENAEKEYQLVVWFSEGYIMEKLEVPFAESPQFKVKGNYVVFKYGKRSLSFTHDDLQRFTLEEIVPVATDISSINEKIGILMEPGGMRIVALPGDKVQVFGVSGLLLSQIDVPSEGEVFVPMNDYQRGTYIIRCGDTSCKVTMR